MKSKRNTISENISKRRGDKIDEEFAYLDLLDDNSPRNFPEYNAEAKILKKQIDSPSVSNIAVVAKYGAGKSSVINTYLHNYRRTKQEKKKNIILGKPESNRYTRITLSTFNNIEYDEAAIERSILQQLLYSRKKSELPNSEIKRTNKTPIWQSMLLTFLLMLFIASATLFGIEASGIHILGTNIEWLKYLLITLSVVLLFVFLFWLIYFRKLTKIKYRDFEVDICSENSDGKFTQTTSLINKFVDEVLYFFDCVNIDLVIFEDLDRLPTTEIFAKLRELNTIINGSSKRGDKVTFLYAAKDDLFKTEEERAKFFEFILPVVPVINPVTTGDELRKQLDKLVKRNENLILTEKFIKGVATYIPNMRILKNTLNDYIIMYSKIFEDTDAKSGHLNQEKLFALSLYKNLYPYDYALLEKNAGLIKLVVDIDKLRETSVAANKVKIEEAKARLNALQNEKLKSIAELKCIFLWQVRTYSYRSRYSNDPQSPINIRDDNFSFEGLNQTHIGHWQQTNYFLEFPSGKTEVLLPNGDRFADRESIINEQCENGGNATKTLITSLEKERQTLFGYSFAELVALQGVSACFPENLQEQYISKYKIELRKPYSVQLEDEIFKQQVDSQIRYLRFLVVNRYIDERYIEYTSNYKAQLITQKDAQFVADVQIKIQDFDYIPNDIKSIIVRLDDDDFKNESILNKRLLDNLEQIKFLDEKEGTQKYAHLISLLSKSTDTSVFDTIREYIAVAENNQVETLLRVLIPLRPTLCEELLSDGKLENDKTDLLAVCVIKYGATDYKAQNNKNILANYLGDHTNYLSLLEISGEDNSIAIIKAIQPTFKKLRRENLNGAIQKYIINNNLYDLTLQNLEVIFCVEYPQDLNEEFYARHFGFILASDKESVIAYITANINKYASAVLLNDKVTFEKEEQNQVEVLLKNEKIDIETRKAIAVKSNIQIVDILEFDAEIYSTLLDENKIEPTWKNIIIAYSEIGYEKSVNNYILNHTLTGDFAWDNDDEKKNTPLALFSDIIGNYLCFPKDIRPILSTIKIEYTLSQFDIETMLKEHTTTTTGGDKMIDKNLAVAIELGQFSYVNSDIKMLYPIPVSRNAYLKKYEAEILAEFDIFFDCAMPQVAGRQQVYENGQYVYKNTYQAKPTANSLIGVIVGANGVSCNLKETLIEKCLPIIDIKDYEKSYAKFFIEEKIAVPTNILWQFTSVSNVSESEKRTLLWLSVTNGIDMTKELDKYKAYFKSLGKDWGNVYEQKYKVKVKQEDSTEQLLKVLKIKGLLTYKKSNKLEEFFGGPTFIIETV